MNISDLKDYNIQSAPMPTNVKDLQGNFTQQPQVSEASKQPDFLQKAGDFVNSIFPGKQVGQAIGTATGALYTKGKDIITGSDNYKNYDLSAPKPFQVAGDITQGALTVAAPEMGNGATALGRIGANTALGAGLGATNAVAEGKGLGDVAKSGAIGGALGGGVSAGAEGIRALSENLPRWLTKMALPKLDTKNVDYALKNTKMGSLSSLQTQSNASMSSYENSIQNILSHPEFKSVAEDSGQIVDQAMNKFGNSNYTPQDLIDNARNIAPKVGKLIDKFEAGQADIQEINSIRKELDAATKSVYTSLNRPPEAKLLGATLSNSMRDFVQTNAPETQSIFKQYAQEIGLNKALGVAVKKGEQKVKLGDLIAGGAGFAKGGFSGALEGIIAERLLTNPAAQLGGAKIIQGASKIAAPVGKALLQGGKAPLIKQATQ